MGAYRFHYPPIDFFISQVARSEDFACHQEVVQQIRAVLPSLDGGRIDDGSAAPGEIRKKLPLRDCIGNLRQGDIQCISYEYGFDGYGPSLR